MRAVGRFLVEVVLAFTIGFGVFSAVFVVDSCVIKQSPPSEDNKEEYRFYRS